MKYLMLRVLPRVLVGVRSRCGAWFGVLLIALLVLGSPARAAQPRLLAPVGPTGAPVEDAEENTSVALRESRPDAVRGVRHAHDERRTPPPLRPVSLTVAACSNPPTPPDSFGRGLGSRLRI
jgi:hypothetical protein